VLHCAVHVLPCVVPVQLQNACWGMAGVVVLGWSAHAAQRSNITTHKRADLSTFIIECCWQPHRASTMGFMTPCKHPGMPQRLHRT
jgi:hypothetical protein